MGSGRNIVIAVDDSPSSKQAFDWAVKKLIMPVDSVKVVTVVDPAERPALLAPGGVAIEIHNDECKPDQKQLERRNKMMKEYESTLKKRGASGVSTRTIVGCIGTSYDHGRHICEFAQENNADMIIIGSRGMGSFSKNILGMFGLGSVSNFVANHATVPNILIHKYQKEQ